jgi:hypothetical protein
MKKFNIAIIASFGIGLLCFLARFIIKRFIPVNSHNIIIDPIFYLTTLGLFFLILGVLLLVNKTEYLFHKPIRTK